MPKTEILSPKKQARLQVIAQLRTALPGLEEALGQKEFDSRLKKVARLLTDGIKLGKTAKKVKIKQEKAA